VQIIGLMMEEEVRELVGERSQPQAERRANRWGSEPGGRRTRTKFVTAQPRGKPSIQAFHRR